MIIETIDDLLPAIESKEEFRVMEKADGYTVIDYIFMDKNTFDDERCLECRGIKFDTYGKIIARPLKKFFNLGERQEVDTVDWTQPHSVVEKMDGSMIHAAYVKGELRLMTRKGITDIAKRVEDIFLKQPDYYVFMNDCVSAGMTPIFEYTAPDNRIVLRYNEPALTVIATRNMHTGVTYPVHARAPRPSIPFVSKRTDYRQGNKNDVWNFLEALNDEKGIEGVVITFDDGHMLKVKTEEYVMMHRALDDMSSKKKVLNLVLSGYADDVKPVLSAEDRQELEDFEAKVNHRVTKLGKLVLDAVFEYEECGMSRKSFATLRRDDPLVSSMFQFMDEKGTSRELVRQQCLKHLELLAEVKWRGE